MKSKTSESVKLPIVLIQYAKAYKLATGVAMTTFIEESVNQKLDKLPKKIKAKMIAIDPTLVF